MGRSVVAISGRTCTGKSGLARRLAERFGYHRIKTSALARSAAEKRGALADRRALQVTGDALDEETESRWVWDAFNQEISSLAADVPVVIDSIRTWKQLEPFRASREYDLIHVHLYGPTAELRSRFLRKHGSEEFDEADLIKGDEDIGEFERDADVRINTHYTDGEDTFVRVAARLRLYAPPHIRCVDVLVGGAIRK